MARYSEIAPFYIYCLGYSDREKITSFCFSFWWTAYELGYSLQRDFHVAELLA